MKITQEQVEKVAIDHYGVVPPMVKQMYNVSPAVAFHYIVGVTALSDSGFSSLEQQAIQLRVSSLNNCESCMKGHSFLLKNAGMSEDDIAAIRGGLSTSDQKIDRLVGITSLVFTGGRTGFDGVIEKLESLKASKQEIFEIISLMASKTISNYINNYSQSVKQNLQPLNQ